jgi:hypothetical protein
MTNCHRIKWSHGEIVSYLSDEIPPGTQDKSARLSKGVTVYHTLTARTPRRDATTAIVIFIEICDGHPDVIHYTPVHPDDSTCNWIPYFRRVAPQKTFWVARPVKRGNVDGLACFQFHKIKWGSPDSSIDPHSGTFPFGDEFIPVKNSIQYIDCE